MITCLTLLKNREEYERLLAAVRKYAAAYTEEMWNYLFFQSIPQVEKLLDTEPVLDLISWDITMKGALGLLEKMRRRNKDAYLMVIADTSISPMAYLRPGIAPGALLLKPVGGDDMEMVVRDLFELMAKREGRSQEDSFLVETREGKQYVPLGQIDCFEAKEKKVFVRTKSCEYGFYDTLDTLEIRLPPGFARCHRSYIANMKRARMLRMDESVIEMTDGAWIPFSRSYKKALKEYFKHV